LAKITCSWAVITNPLAIQKPLAILILPVRPIANPFTILSFIPICNESKRRIISTTDSTCDGAIQVNFRYFTKLDLTRFSFSDIVASFFCITLGKE